MVAASGRKQSGPWCPRAAGIGSRARLRTQTPTPTSRGPGGVVVDVIPAAAARDGERHASHAKPGSGVRQLAGAAQRVLDFLWALEVSLGAGAGEVPEG